MACLIDLVGRKRKCKDSAGGVKNIYISVFRPILRNEVDIDCGVITKFPPLTFFKWEGLTGVVYNQQQQENEGGKFYPQRISFQFNGLSGFDNLYFQRLFKKDVFLIVEDNNGHFWLLGFRNGLECVKLTSHTDNYYTADFEGLESGLSPNVDEVMGGDFTVIDEDYFKIFQDEIYVTFQDDIDYLFN